jgi:hypothetical protein
MGTLRKLHVRDVRPLTREEALRCARERLAQFLRSVQRPSDDYLAAPSPPAG